MPVSKIIHQTYKNEKNLPEKWKESQREWKRLHPDWEYKFWSDQDLRDLIVSDYPWILATYDAFRYPIQRVDTARYCILHKFGGVYSDFDIIPLRPIDEFVKGDFEVFLARSPRFKQCSSNHLMASIPGSGFWNEVLSTITPAVRCKKLIDLSKHLHIMCTTGPIRIDMVTRESTKTAVTYFPPYYFSWEAAINSPQEAAVKHVQGRSWCSWDSMMMNLVTDNLLLFSIIGVLSIISIILLLVIFTFLYLRCKRKRASGECPIGSACS
jgi:mannosyltransferase OCH1-like enzyme